MNSLFANRTWSVAGLLALACIGAVAGFTTSRLVHRETPTAVPAAIATSQAHDRPRAEEIAPLTTEALNELEQRWAALASKPRTPERDDELVALAAELGRSDPERALALARKSANWQTRKLVLNAALRGWATAAPDDASAWALGQRDGDRVNAVGAVIAGAAQLNAHEATRIAERAAAADPRSAADFGHAAIIALAEKGNFDAATQFANFATTDRKTFLLDTAYYQWAIHDPQMALLALGRVTDTNEKSQARRAVIQGWAATDPRAAVDYALKLHAESRRDALLVAIPELARRERHAALQVIDSSGLAAGDAQTLRTLLGEEPPGGEATTAP